MIFTFMSVLYLFVLGTYGDAINLTALFYSVCVFVYVCRLVRLTTLIPSIKVLPLVHVVLDLDSKYRR